MYVVSNHISHISLKSFVLSFNLTEYIVPLYHFVVDLTPKSQDGSEIKRGTLWQWITSRVIVVVVNLM